VGPKDLEKKQFTVVRRDTGEKDAIPMKDCTEKALQSVLDDIQKTLFAQAESFMKDHTHTVDSFDDLEKVIDGDGGFVWAPWDGTIESAQVIQNKLKASIRLLGDAKKAKGKKDLVSGVPALEMALFAKAY
jgi:prolyl-tRNA synthetase